MKWMFLFLLMIPAGVFAQSTVVVSVEKAEIKAKPDNNSQTLRTVKKGMEFEYSGSIRGWVILTDGGFIFGENVTAKDVYLEQGGTLQVAPMNETEPSELLTKDPAELTEKELLYLLLQEQRKSDNLQSDVRTIKNIQIGFAVLTAVSLIANIILLTSL